MVILDWIDRFCRIVVAAGMATMIAAITLHVALRYVFNAQIGGTVEIARFAFVWLTFMGAVCAFKQRGHLSIDLVTGFFGLRGRVALDIVLCLLTLVTCYFLLVYGYALTERTWSQISPTLRVPMGAIYGAIPLSGLLIGISAAFEAIAQTADLLGGRIPSRHDQHDPALNKPYSEGAPE